MMSKIRVRPVEQEDVFDLKQFCLKSVSVDMATKLVVKQMRKEEKGSGVRLVLEVDGRVVGTGVFDRVNRGNKAHLIKFSSFRLHGDYQGKGLAGELFRAGEGWARKRGAEKIILGVKKGSGAIDIYRHWGFVEYGLLPGGTKLGGRTSYDVVLMYKELKYEGA